MSQADFSRPGAVDLSGLRQPANRPPGGAAAGGHVAGAFVRDVTEPAFQAEVIEQSLRFPVVVEFWSPRSDVSGQLGPVLARLSTEYAGKFLLARVDVDANPGLAQAVGVQSVPLVIAVVRGQVVPLFQGAVAEAEARQYLDQLLTVAVANGITGRAEPAAGAEEPETVVDERYVRAEDAVAGGDLDGAAAVYEELLAQTPNDTVAKSGLARVKLVQRTREVPDEVRQRAERDPADVEAQCLVADAELVGGDVEAAFARLIRTVQQTAGDDRDAARVHLLELFEVVGGDDPSVVTARRQLMTALF